MPKITFTLKNPKAKSSPIQLLFTCSDGRLKYYTGEQTDPKAWPETNKGTRAVLRRIESHIEGLIIDHKIKDRVLFTITKGGRREDTYLEKWQMVSCHTARRSFVTNLRKNGVADSIVMKLTGIKSAGTLRRYDKLSSEEAADIARWLWFFR